MVERSSGKFIEPVYNLIKSSSAVHPGYTVKCMLTAPVCGTEDVTSSLPRPIDPICQK